MRVLWQLPCRGILPRFCGSLRLLTTFLIPFRALVDQLHSRSECAVTHALPVNPENLVNPVQPSYWVARRHVLSWALEIRTEFGARGFAHQGGLGFPFHRAAEFDEEVRFAGFE